MFPVIKSKQQTWRPVDSAAVSWLSKTSGAAETQGTSTREGFCRRACNLGELHGKARTESFGLVEMVAEELHIGKRVVERDEEIAMASICFSLLWSWGLVPLSFAKFPVGLSRKK